MLFCFEADHAALAADPRHRLHEYFHVIRSLQRSTSRPAKTWGPVDGVGCAMFGWRMEEEAKIQFTITANWQRGDGSITTTQLGTVDRDGCRSAKDVGLQLADAKRILGRLQEVVALRYRNCCPSG